MIGVGESRISGHCLIKFGESMGTPNPNLKHNFVLVIFKTTFKTMFLYFRKLLEFKKCLKFYYVKQKNNKEFLNFCSIFC